MKVFLMKTDVKKLPMCVSSFIDECPTLCDKNVHRRNSILHADDVEYTQ